MPLQHYILGILLLAFVTEPARSQDVPYPLNYVDPRIGTGSAGWGIGHNNPGAQVAFGPLRLGPDTSYDSLHIQWSHFGGYWWGDTHIQCFSHTHMVGAGVPDYGNFGVTPLRMVRPTSQTISRHNYRSLFSHDQETMYPGFYSVYLDTHQTFAELTAAGTHAGLHRYTYTPGSPMTLLLDICHSVQNGAEACREASVNVTQNGDITEINASVLHAGSMTQRNGKGVWIYFYAEVQSTSIAQQIGLWADGNILPGETARSNELSRSLGAYINFGDAIEGRTNQLNINVGISFISPTLARRNMEAQIAGRSFDRVKAETVQNWADLLGSKIQVKASRETDLVKFYTSLYRTYMSPTIYSESDGSYLGADEIVHTIESGHNYYSDLSLWDTYRSQNPWLNLVAASVGEDVVRSLVLMIEQFGDLPRWPIAHVYAGGMFGDNADMLFLDAWRKGLRNFNITKAYEAMKANAMEPNHKDSRGGIEAYMQLGYVPIETNKRGTCYTLAYAYNDWCVAEVANILGYTSDETYFRQRAQNYRNVFDVNELFMCPRYSNGTFLCPKFPDFPYNEYFVEGNTWHYTWDVPHDIEAFIQLWPSVQDFVDKLEYSMNSSTTLSMVYDNNWAPNKFYWQGNEHDLLFPWEFHQAGRTDLTQYWTRWILEHRYTEKPSGLPGNDDYGTMSAWYTFGALGFYPLAGADWYFVGSPVVDQAVLFLENGSQLIIEALNNSPSNVYVESVSLNGHNLETPFLTHDQIANGAHLVFQMTSTPNTPFNLFNNNKQTQKFKNK